MPVKSELFSHIASETDPLLSLESGGTEIYLIRHGNALPDANEVADGSYDDQPLSELGRRQSLALAERIKELSIAAIYSSPIRRAFETASFIGDALGLTICINEELREVGLQQDPHLFVHLGSEERVMAVRAYLHDVEIAALQVGIWSQISGCEPSETLRTRLTLIVNHIASQYVGKRVAIITHAGAINAYIAASLGLERDFFFPALNTSISVVRVREKQQLLVRLNDTAHLSRLNNLE